MEAPPRLSKERDSNVPVLYSLRAIAALSVCIHHFILNTVGFIHNKDIRSLVTPGRYGVEMFFVISGFIIPWSMYYGGYTFKRMFNFILKRLTRLEPPYIASIALAILIPVLRAKLLTPHSAITINPVQIMLHFGYLIPFSGHYNWLIVVYWTLAIEFQFYLLMAFIYPLLVKNKIAIRLILYAGAIVFMFYTSDSFLPYYVPFFMLGILLFLRKTNHIPVTEFYAISAIMMLACIHQLGYWPMLYTLAAFIAIGFFEKRDNKILHFIGELSYSIYLFHLLSGQIFINLLSHYTHTPVMKALLVIGGIGVTIVSSYLVYITIERPSQRLSKKIRYKNKLKIAGRTI